MRQDIGIAILDVYTQDDLNACVSHLPKSDNIIIVSDTKNTIPNVFKVKRYGNGVPFATLRNWAISQFRLKGDIKHIFLISTNQIVKDVTIFNEIFNKIIKTAETFGTRLIFGPEVSVLSIEDDEKNIELTLSEKINSDFIYISNDIVSEIGYFDERFFNTKNLDVLDYIERLREKKLHTPTGFNPMIVGDIQTTRSKIQKTNYKEIDNRDKTVDASYAYFLHKYKYIPTQNDPKPVSNDDLMTTLEELQTNYGSK
jgi:hypothetical protein